MKKIILSLVVIALLSACSEKKIAVSVIGSSELPDMNGKVLIMEQIMDGHKMASDTLKIIENKINKVLKLDSASVRVVYTMDKDIEPFEIFLEKGKININIDKNRYVTVSGTPMNDQLQICYDGNLKFKKAMQAIKAAKYKEEAEKGLSLEERQAYIAKFDSVVNINNSRTLAFIKDNINNPVGKYYFYKSYFFFPYEIKQEMMSFATDDIKAAYKK
jgi:hypothetical protein